MDAKGWGKICITTRLEKQVEAEFVASWTGLLMQGLRKGDAVRLTRGKVAHVAQNENARAFLLETDCDTFLSLDSDADFEPGFLETLRNYEPGYVYDLFQAFHLRRTWPPEAIWLASSRLMLPVAALVLSAFSAKASICSPPDMVSICRKAGIMATTASSSKL